MNTNKFLSEALQFGKANAKLIKLQEKTGKKLYTFSILSGHFCPFADACLSKAIYKGDGKFGIQDGPNTQFRCFSATQEAFYPTVRNSRLSNSDLLRNTKDQVKLICDSLPSDAGIIRIHVGGDFYNQPYFDAWLEVARLNPNVIFYAYTKSLPFWIARLNVIPQNVQLTASYGGHKDELIEKHNLKSAVVIYSVNEARKMKIPIDHTDEHAMDPKCHKFGLLIHSTQPPKSKAAKALVKLKGLGSYGKKSKNKVQ